MKHFVQFDSEEEMNKVLGKKNGIGCVGTVLIILALIGAIFGKDDKSEKSKKAEATTEQVSTKKNHSKSYSKTKKWATSTKNKSKVKDKNGANKEDYLNTADEKMPASEEESNKKSVETTLGESSHSYESPSAAVE